VRRSQATGTQGARGLRGTAERMMRSVRATATVTATVMAALVMLAGCGGGGGDAPPVDAAASDGEAIDADGIDAAPDAVAPLGDILVELRAIPGLTVTEQSTMIEGYRFFLLSYQQPVDHAAPGGARFTQRMTLLHRGYDAPMVAYNSGYFVSSRGVRAQLTLLLDGNQLSMEHRYFEPSRPSPADWTKLDIAQAAADQHRITAALQARIYRRPWLTTGASKGGMTSLFHRRFYPDDVVATVAYVAPIDYPEDAVASADNRFFQFLAQVGTDAACRQRLQDFQREVLLRGPAMRQRMGAPADYAQLLGVDRALEFATEELPFIFWQYGRQSDCASIPGAAASDDEVFQFLDDTVSVAAYADADLTDYLPYYHQSATQLGYPASDERHLADLVQFPGGNTARAYIATTIPVPPSDNGAAMRDVQDWIASDGARLMLIYGQNDPWTAGAAELGAATDSWKYIAPSGNHGASLTTLTSADTSAAVATIRRWAGVSAKPGVASDAALRTGEPTAEAVELAWQRAHRGR
jgi:hypothetical protein